MENKTITISLEKFKDICTDVATTESIEKNDLMIGIIFSTAYCVLIKKLFEENSSDKPCS